MAHKIIFASSQCHSTTYSIMYLIYPTQGSAIIVLAASLNWLARISYQRPVSRPVITVIPGTGPQGMESVIR